MRKIIALLIFQISLLSSQQISYIVPDIGAPGMAIYIDIIGPSNIKNNFGTELLSYNNSSDKLRISAIDPAHQKFLTFGPIISSWDGRMLSTQAFISPFINPNSSDWTQLNSNFRIPIGVYVDGSLSNIDTFYIVQPWKLGNISLNTERILGEGTLGMRSKRGAMIVDSLILANATYTVSIKDCDLTTEGNQAYLPFILIAKGRIIGQANTILNLDAGKGRVENAGPGGGGGGGMVCDNFANSGPGGDGFTGGGPGGSNMTIGTNSRDNVGIGTAKAIDVFDSKGKRLIGGPSMNGVKGGEASNTIYESAGGGTGHPFGESARDCIPGADCDNNIGKFGAGASAGQNSRGGSAGHSTLGNATNSSGRNGGKVYGNAMGIPLAGGSGGASGNPQIFLGGCAGAGGGGGAAVRIAATYLENFTISAKGANGNGSSNGTCNGGDGSGGFVDLNSKSFFNLLKVNVDGGARAGAGRFRQNSMTPDIDPCLTSAASRYFGSAIDTTHYINRKDTITGSFQTDRTLQVFLKFEGQDWENITNKVNIAGNTFSYVFDIKSKDTLIYISTYQDEATFIPGDFTYSLKNVLSQASCNVLRKNKAPIITGDSIRNSILKACPDEAILDSFKIYNLGDADLALDFNNSFFKNNIGISLLNPKSGIVNVKPDDSLTIYIEIKSKKSANIIDTLFLAHNDKFASYLPWKIGFNYRIEIPAIEAKDSLNKKLDITLANAFYLGDICWGNSIGKSFKVYNRGIDLVNLKLQAPSNAAFGATLTGNKTLNPGDSVQLNIGFTSSLVAYADTIFVNKYYLFIEECPFPLDSIMIYVTMYKIDYSIDDIIITNNQKDINFGSNLINSTKNIKIRLKNNGKKLLSLSNNTFITNNVFKQITNLTGVNLLPGANIDIEFSFTPPDTGSYKDFIRLNLQMGDCNQLLTINLNGDALPIKKAIVRIDSVISLPTNKDLTIPVYAKFTNSTDPAVNIGLKARINFRKTLLVLNQSSNFIITKDSTNNNTRFVEFQVSKADISTNDSLLFNLYGSALIGDTIKTPINWDYLIWDNPSEFMTDKLINGSLEISICEEGGQRLITDNPLQKMAYLINNTDLSVDVTVMAVGNYQLDIFGLNGNFQNIKIWNHSLENSKEYDINFSLDRFANGLYYLRLITPSGIIIKPIIFLN